MNFITQNACVKLQNEFLHHKNSANLFMGIGHTPSTERSEYELPFTAFHQKCSQTLQHGYSPVPDDGFRLQDNGFELFGGLGSDVQSHTSVRYAFSNRGSTDLRNRKHTELPVASCKTNMLSARCCKTNTEICFIEWPL